jgi:hypothetical protein
MQLRQDCRQNMARGELARADSDGAQHVDATMLRQTPNLSLVFLGYLLLAVIMSTLYVRVARGTGTRGSGSSTRHGLLFGVVAGVCWLMPYSLVLFGVYRFPYVALLLDFAWALVEQGVGGLVIGQIHRQAVGRNEDMS